MAIRARLKNKLKKMLGRDQDRQETAATPSQAYSPPSQSKPTLQPEAPSLVVSAPQEEPQIEEEKEEKEEAITLEEPQEREEETQAAPSETAAKPEEISEEISAEAVVSAQKEKIAPPESITTAQNTDGATYVFEIKNLFPESCPSCEESSRNNWFWKDGSFACGSCEEHY